MKSRIKIISREITNCSFFSITFCSMIRFSLASFYLYNMASRRLGRPNLFPFEFKTNGVEMAINLTFQHQRSAFFFSLLNYVLWNWPGTTFVLKQRT